MNETIKALNKKQKLQLRCCGPVTTVAVACGPAAGDANAVVDDYDDYDD